MQIPSMKKCIILPLSDIQDQAAWNVGRDCMFDLFVTNDLLSTIDDLLSFVKDRANANGILDVKFSHLNFEFKLLGSNKVIVPKLADRKSVV